jgi:hypothetical protein
MATKQTSQKGKHPRKHEASGKHAEHEANLGQNEARLDKDKESELSRMGEMSRAADPDRES